MAGAKCAGWPGSGSVATLAFVMAVAFTGCAPREETASTPLPTRQTTVDPVLKKLDAVQQEAERRRAEADGAGK
jgi:hypothetical protein